MAHQSGMGRGVTSPGATIYSLGDQHIQPHMQSPLPPTSPIFTGPVSMAGPVTPSCTTPPLGSTNIPRYPLPSSSHSIYPTDQHHVSPVRNVMDPGMPLHYQYPPYYSRRPRYPDESPLSSSPGSTHHVPGYPTGVQTSSNISSFPNKNIPKRTAPVKSGIRRNPGLQIDFSPQKQGEKSHEEGYPPLNTQYGQKMLRSPGYTSISPSIPGNVSEEIKQLRVKVVEYFYQNIELIRKRYQDNLKELFFLQHGGNLIDFPVWCRRPNPHWFNYQETHKLEDDIDFYVTSNPMENMQVQNIGQDYVATQQNFYQSSFGNMQPEKLHGNAGAVIMGTSQQSGSLRLPYIHPSNSIEGHIDLASSKIYMSKDSTFGTLLPTQHAKHGLNCEPENLAAARAFAINQSKEDIMVEAKREADILKRVAELRKEGLWSTKRLPKVQESSRNKTHWDYVLEEMAWLSTDFAQERRWKKNVAKKVS